MKTDWQPRTDGEMSEVIRQSLVVLPILNDEDLLRNKALLFKALGDETRLKIIGILKIQETCLCELVSGLGIPASTLTHHLQILERGGVILSRKEKKFTIFSLAANIEGYLE
ncbi:metalloregulator ArsR/SmtB family transcription factor [Paenibacillus sp. LC-T2]|uniref:Metalloregulator ArsR/SmtB family transcription factor n=2 Tax=Paenibacillus monticola TaxID=2666075 RepID=A0A7X2H3F8_9BACL|nr:metalloregulator ArsR/SmtB family transcription factor [Paenibacillus monticola]